jgi:hypothetical protein
VHRRQRRGYSEAMKRKSYRICMLVGAAALLGVACFYFGSYVVKLKVALDNNNLEPFLVSAIKALWLCFASQALLIGLLYLLVAYKPHSVTREVIVMLGLIQLVEAILLFALAGSKVLSLLLVVAALFVLIGAALWPSKPEPEDAEPASSDSTPIALPPANP